MFKAPDSRLSASNAAVLSSQSFLIPVTLRSEARTSQGALDGLQNAHQEVTGFVARMTALSPGLSVIAFDEAMSSRLSHVAVLLDGKDSRLELTFALKYPIPATHDFWARIKLISSVYDRLAELAAGFQDRKGIDLLLDEARPDQQKEETERAAIFRK
ncbi:MAG: hypothetical protein K0Q55_3403 [Verrucomicrobia bacterium]|jgi:hypothetical protein|nr:hypothetical protein [Verrucomicrobiota bacterium]